MGRAGPSVAAAPAHPELPPAWNEAIEAFTHHVAAVRGRSPHTVAAYRRDATQVALVLAAAGIAGPDDTRYVDLRRYLGDLDDHGYA
ncbi:MAG TPA: site-specific integrase, partial [Solirubrobacteraceae bacterium]|nr:site-specific integrase [Solirubrobacteraceae bacterium]